MIENVAAKSFLFSTEAIVFGVLTFLLWMFYQGLGRQYVKFWTLSLACLCIINIAQSIDSHFLLTPETDQIRIVLTWINQVSTYLFITLLGLGIYVAKFSREISVRTAVFISIAAIIFATIVTLICATSPDHVYDRYFLRVTLKAFLLGCCLISLGTFLGLNKPHHFSSRIFTYLFLITGTEKLVFSFSSTLAMSEWWFQYVSIFSTYFEVGANAVLGFSMLIWMQGAERNAAIVAMSQAQYLGKHDSLTGTLNRVQILERLPSFMQITKEKGGKLGVALIDLKRFKFINDTYGLKTGDYILGEVAKRLGESIFKPKLVGRLSGDSFVVVIDYEDDIQMDNLSAHLHELIARPFTYDGQDVVVQCSLGYCTYPEFANSAEDLLQNANLALFHAESHNLASKAYNHEMQVQGRHLLAMEKSIKAGIKSEEFELYFQPQLNLLTNNLEGVEALVRWNHPTQGLLTPNKFLPDVDALGLNNLFDLYVLEKACQAHKRWLSSHKMRITIAVNVTAVEFQDPRLISTIQQLLLKYEMSPKYLELEITENVVMTDLRSAMDTIVILQNMGIKVSIDDFGTGYSSLAYLRELPIDKIKIDRSFIQEMASNDSDVTIVKSMIKLSHGLGKRVLAEGVETSSQLNVLRDLGCDAVQGYFIAKPIPEQELTAYFERK